MEITKEMVREELVLLLRKYKDEYALMTTIYEPKIKKMLKHLNWHKNRIKNIEEDIDKLNKMI